jgi:hypothetical protein
MQGPNSDGGLLDLSHDGHESAIILQSSVKLSRRATIATPSAEEVFVDLHLRLLGCEVSQGLSAELHSRVEHVVLLWEQQRVPYGLGVCRACSSGRTFG